MPRFGFDHSFARSLPQAGVAWKPAPASAPRLAYLNRPLAEALGLDLALLQGPEGAGLLSGNPLPDDAQPIAQAYAGHQFGGFSPQLGDGRALLLGELVGADGQRRDIALKGSGRTPFSRGGDGKAALGPMLREALLGEAMHALGVPTTRALAVVATGDDVQRERVLPGAVLVRVAASHLRVGSFQYFAARGDTATLRALADHAIARHDPALAALPSPEREAAWLRAVAQRQARLIAQWMNIGFIHGVMNTDNMALSGETIDYGPCAFMEGYNPQAVFSSIDHGGRYAYANQPLIARWNLARFAEALLPLMATPDDEAAVARAVQQATEVVDAFPDLYDQALRDGQRAKLGLHHTQQPEDAALAEDWLDLLEAQSVDFTLAWRLLADATPTEPTDNRASPATANTTVGTAASVTTKAPAAPLLRGLFTAPEALDAWLARWHARCRQDDAATPGISTTAATRAERMRTVNPWVIPRNHRVEEALDAATERGDLQPFAQLLDALRAPFTQHAPHARYAEPAPAAVTAGYRTFCGT